MKYAFWTLSFDRDSAITVLIWVAIVRYHDFVSGCQERVSNIAYLGNSSGSRSFIICQNVGGRVRQSQEDACGMIVLQSHHYPPLESGLEVVERNRVFYVPAGAAIIQISGNGRSSSRLGAWYRTGCQVMGFA